MRHSTKAYLRLPGVPRHYVIVKFEVRLTWAWAYKKGVSRLFHNPF